MKIKFFATLRQVVGEKSIDFPLNGPTSVDDVLSQLIHRFPGLKSELLDEDGHLLERVHVLINGRDVRFLDDNLDTQVTSEDTISLFPAVGGGSNLSSSGDFTGLSGTGDLQI